MNSKIFNMFIQKLEAMFNLPKYNHIPGSFNKDTVVSELNWSPARFAKFSASVSDELQLDNIDMSGTVEDIVARLDSRYMHRFFGEIWKPTTEQYQYSGWALVDEINKQDPVAVLDFGCGYNQFKGRIKNLVGIDPFNNCADYMVDIMEFDVPPESFDHIIVFGSLNFNDRDGIYKRFAKLCSLLKPGGKMYFRANPGNSWPNGPYVDIFPWSFNVAYDLSQKYGVSLDLFKRDNNDRFYFVYSKNVIS